MCTIQPNQLIELVSGLQIRHPGIELELKDASAAELEHRLLGGELEVAIYCRPSEPPDGQGVSVLEKRGWDDLRERVMVASYSASRSLRTAAI
jgi:DNA-binding transcriptional LysR family regulator